MSELSEETKKYLRMIYVNKHERGTVNSYVTKLLQLKPNILNAILDRIASERKEIVDLLIKIKKRQET